MKKKLYESVIQQVFKDFQCKKFEGNNFSNAILPDSKFSEFQKAFLDKLNRIKPLISLSNTKWEKTIYNILNSISDNKNYAGAWAELCAIDTFYAISQQSYYDLNCEIDKNASETLGNYYQKTITNYDLSFGDNLLLDVKILADKEEKIIQDICNELTKDTDIHILPEISYQLEYGAVTSKIKEIKNEIREVITNSNQNNFRSNIIEDLSYKIQKGKGVLMACGSYDPYQYAENEHKLIFQHFNKLHTEIPTILIYVLHPWYSDRTLCHGFKESRAVPFRSMARRLFVQYKNKKIDDLLPENATQYLTGLMFIIDNSPINKENEIFFYLNPNAKNKLHKMCKDSIKYSINVGGYEDFEFDNY